MEVSWQLSYTEALIVLLFLDEEFAIFTLWQSKWNCDLWFTIYVVWHFYHVSRQHKAFWHSASWRETCRGEGSHCVPTASLKSRLWQMFVYLNIFTQPKGILWAGVGVPGLAELCRKDRVDSGIWLWNEEVLNTLEDSKSCPARAYLWLSCSIKLLYFVIYSTSVNKHQEIECVSLLRWQSLEGDLNRS